MRRTGSTCGAYSVFIMRIEATGGQVVRTSGAETQVGIEEAISTRHSADGVVSRSAVLGHARPSVSAWVCNQPDAVEAACRQLNRLLLPRRPMRGARCRAELGDHAAIVDNVELWSGVFVPFGDAQGRPVFTGEGSTASSSTRTPTASGWGT